MSLQTPLTLEALNAIKISSSTVDVHARYVELLKLTKDELIRDLIHKLLIIEALGSVIGSQNDVMFAVANQLKKSSGRGF